MKIELRLKFSNLKELEDWYNGCCTRCAMCNKENGKNDPCEFCRCEKIYKEWDEFFRRGGKK